jgi:putative Mg2+ transporter-C (MgtC) family protein
MITPVTELEAYIQLIVALLLGAMLGFERLIAGKEAGMRTFGLVSVGACLLVILGEVIFEMHPGATGADPGRMASSIVTGVGFIGAGLIIFQHELRGLTTAATLWVASAIGSAVGLKMYNLAVFSAFLTLFVTVGLWFVEHYIQKKIALHVRE